MNPKRTSTQVFYVVVAVALLLWFNYSNKKIEKAPAQVAYEEWLMETLPKLQNPKINDAPVPKVTVTLSSQEKGLNWNLAYDPNTNPEKVVRLLEMFRETDLLSMRSKNQPDLTLTVNAGERIFSANFSVNDLDGNSKAQAMFKLFELYTQSPKQELTQRIEQQ